MANKNIIIAPCGNKSSLFQTHWLKNKADKQFDVCLLFYHAEIHQPELYQDAEYFFHLKDFKFSMIYDLLKNQAPEMLQQYEYFYFMDDDVAIETDAINKLFAMSALFDTWIAQASLTHDSHDSWPVLRTQPECVLRYMGQIEVMAPLFNRYALQVCLPSFIANRSSWGLDSVWSKMLDYPQNKIAVMDLVAMRHTAPVGGGELYKKLQIDPYVEWEQVTRHYNAIQNNFRELGRVQVIEGQKSKTLYMVVRMRIKIKKLIQHLLKGNLTPAIRGYVKGKQRDHTVPVKA